MIDTDKYKTKKNRNWELKVTEQENDFNYEDIIAVDSLGKESYTVAQMVDTGLEDAQLIADAPLLLAEVKRLRGLLKITAQSYLDDVRAVDMLGEVSVKKEYETCQEIADVLGVSIVSGHTLHDMFHANGSEFGRYFVYLDEDGEMVMMND